MNNVKLICFDLDETIISHSSWQQLNLALGISKEDDRAMYEDFIAGRISYEEWNNKVLNFYLKHKDSTREEITEILSRYSYNDGVRESINYLKSKGYIIVLISGSIDILVSIIAHDLGIKYFKANNTFIFSSSNKLQAIHSQGDDKDAKTMYLESFCEMLDVDINECAAIGDGANDIGLFKATGHGVTFKGSNIEKDAWKVIGSFDDLKDIF